MLVKNGGPLLVKTDTKVASGKTLNGTPMVGFWRFRFEDKWGPFVAELNPKWLTSSVLLTAMLRNCASPQLA
jgi:hypothetical protein